MILPAILQCTAHMREHQHLLLFMSPWIVSQCGPLTQTPIQGWGAGWAIRCLMINRICDNGGLSSLSKDIHKIKLPMISQDVVASA